MDGCRTSFELLAHFDGPQSGDRQTALASPNADCDVTSDDDSGRLSTGEDNSQCERSRQNARRGIRWVLKWATAISILAVAASILTQFAFVLAAEQHLNAAARAAISEAILPRATLNSVM